MHANRHCTRNFISCPEPKWNLTSEIQLHFVRIFNMVIKYVIPVTSFFIRCLSQMCACYPVGMYSVLARTFLQSVGGASIQIQLLSAAWLYYIYTAVRSSSCVVGSQFTQAHYQWFVQLGICGCVLVLHTQHCLANALCTPVLLLLLVWRIMTLEPRGGSRIFSMVGLQV